MEPGSDLSAKYDLENIVVLTSIISFDQSLQTPSQADRQHQQALA
jgi:hypothetical protein